MPITIAHQENTQRLWAPVKPGATCYVGGLCAVDTSALTDQGVVMLPQAVGASNTTNKDIPMGVVVGTNLKTPLYDTTAKSHYITAVAAASSHGDATEYTGVEGPWGKGDNRAMVEYIPIDHTTILRASLFDAAVGTAPPVATVTTGSTTGAGCTTTAVGFTPVADLCTIYCRTGGNVGAYRTLDTTSTTVHTWTQYVNNDIAVGDTFVAVPLTSYGPAYCQVGATYASYLDCNVSPSTNYFVIHVIRLDLREAGKEYVEFRFDADNFCIARA